jgi:hypothetical protein
VVFPSLSYGLINNTIGGSDHTMLNGRAMNNEQERMWEGVMTKFDLLSQDSDEGTEENHEKLDRMIGVQ